jgi:hypothetical protein
MGKKNISETEDGDSERLRELGFVFTDRLLELGVNFSDIEAMLKDPNRMDRVAEITQGIGVTYRFAHEEVESTTCYPTEYRPRSIPDQIARLRELFPELNHRVDIGLANRPLPDGAESYFAIPRWEVIAPTYNEAVERVLALMSRNRDDELYDVFAFGARPNCLRQHERTVAMLKKLGDQQERRDILIVPAQFGRRHRGRSVRRAREVFKTNEFGLGAFAIGIMLLTHPEREVRWDQLHIYCAGDEQFDSLRDDDFTYVPIFLLFDGGSVKFGSDRFDCMSERCGSVTAFVP